MTTKGLWKERKTEKDITGFDLPAQRHRADGYNTRESEDRRAVEEVLEVEFLAKGLNKISEHFGLESIPWENLSKEYKEAWMKDAAVLSDYIKRKLFGGEG